jgi:hypothetical protein
MNLSELTNDQLDEQIDTYEDRIETMSDYIRMRMIVQPEELCRVNFKGIERHYRC